MSSVYLSRYAWPTSYLKAYDRFQEVSFIVVIPCFNEKNISRTLESLNECQSPEGQVLVLVIINEPESAQDEIKRTNKEAYNSIINSTFWFHLEVIYVRLPDKKAGVGLARKIGMDEAVRVFDFSNTDGVIICLDADCTCDPNYFKSIERFYQNPAYLTGLVHYEHPLKAVNHEKIVSYELFLRYYVDALRYARFPNAFQTLGSCITVRASAYQKQGGMNTRKAGEDFYFIHKIILLGGLGEINDTRVIPSDRVSDRVPFGTGHAIGKMDEEAESYLTYDPKTFECLKILFESTDKIYENPDELIHLPESITRFHKELNFKEAFSKILDQSNSLENFSKRFFAWWDGFRVLKFVHFFRDQYCPPVPIQDAISWLFEKYTYDTKSSTNEEDLLKIREFDRRNPHHSR